MVRDITIVEVVVRLKNKDMALVRVYGNANLMSLQWVFKIGCQP